MSLEIFTITGSRVLIAIMNRVTRKVEKLALDFFQETRKLLAPLKKLDGTGGDKNEMLAPCILPSQRGRCGGICGHTAATHDALISTGLTSQPLPDSVQQLGCD